MWVRGRCWLWDASDIGARLWNMSKMSFAEKPVTSSLTQSVMVMVSLSVAV